jgi:hypothetical protein
VSLPIHLQFTAGAIAGVSEILFMYPLDGNYMLYGMNHHRCICFANM